MNQSSSTNPAHTHLIEVLDEVGVSPILHAGGTKSSMGGSRVHPEAADIMRAALDVFVPVDQLLAGTGDAVARLLGAESAAVVAGAASGCVLSAAAVRAEAEDRRHPGGRPTLITQRRHYGRYTYLYEQAGCAVRELGTMNDCPASDYLQAIDESTVGVAWLEGPGIRSAGVSLAEICVLAHDRGLPVVVDAAAMAFPLANVHNYLRAGADLVVVSGGKLINGPQGSGFVLGRPDLVQRIRRMGFPHQGTGRAHKITKEVALGAYVALKRFVEQDPATRSKDTEARAERMRELLVHAGIRAEVQCHPRHPLPSVVMGRLGELTGRLPSAWNALLLEGTPRVFCPYDDALDELCVEFASLDPADDDRVADRITRIIAPAVGLGRRPREAAVSADKGRE
jgi:D-glucosaminate-6-phosphate ammonia-lyase